MGSREYAFLSHSQGGAHVDSVTTFWEPLILPICFLLSGIGNPRILQDALGELLGKQGLGGGHEVGEKHISTLFQPQQLLCFLFQGLLGIFKERALLLKCLKVANLC